MATPSVVIYKINEHHLFYVLTDQHQNHLDIWQHCLV